MAQVIIFGLKDYASLANFYLTHDSAHDVAAFCVSRRFMPDPATFEGLPVVPFEEVQENFAPEKYRFFVPMSARSMNRDRADIYREVKKMGYECISYVSSRATVFENAQIGENCFILEGNVVQPFTSIGNNVVLWSGNHIGHHCVVMDHVTITSHVVLSGHCTVKEYCFLGVNATIRDGLDLAEGTLIVMGSSLFSSTEPWGTYNGSPARKTKKPSTEVDI